MSTNRSRQAGAGMRRRPDRRRFTVAVVCAISCLGVLTWYLRTAHAQEPQDAVIPVVPLTTEPAEASGEPTIFAPEQTAPGDTQTAQTAKVPQSLDALLERRGSLEFLNGNLADWLKTIQATWKIDIVYNSASLQNDRYSGRFTDKPLKQILDTILGANEYGYRREEDVLVILPREELGDILPNMKREMIRMEFVTPQEVEPTLELLMSKRGKKMSIPSAKALMIIDFPDSIRKVREHIEELDQFARQNAENARRELERQRQALNQPGTPGELTPSPNIAPDVQLADQIVTTKIPVKYMLADSLVDPVSAVIADGTVIAIPETNDLIISGTRSAIQAAAQIVEKVDVVKRQVRISILMYDVRIDALEQLGVNWRNAGKGRIGSDGSPRTFGDLNSAPLDLGVTASSTSSSSTTSTSTASTPTTAGIGDFVTSASPDIAGSVLTLQHLSRHFDLSAVLVALDQTDGARLLARPSILCYDRRQSEAKVISEIPVQQLTQTDQGGNIGTTTFREAGVTLTVTPWIGEGDVVLLNLAPEFSVLTGFQDGQPIIDRRQLRQWVNVQSGDTLVLGGLRRQNQLETVSGIPGLMNLKYVGGLFRSHRTTVEESELITFVHTEIVDCNYHGLLREQAAAQVVEEALDRIPIASHSPYVPPCNDPYCPIHNPRPKYWEGNMLYGEPLPPGYGGGAPPYLQPRHEHPYYESLPHVEGERMDSHGHNGHGHGGSLQRLAPPNPTPPKPPLEESAPQDAESDHAAPPPVQIDEHARRMMGSRLVLFRLPKVTPEPNSQRLPAVEGGAPPELPARVARQPDSRQMPPAPHQSVTPARRTTTGGWQQQLFR